MNTHPKLVYCPFKKNEILMKIKKFDFILAYQKKRRRHTELYKTMELKNDKFSSLSKSHIARKQISM